MEFETVARVGIAVFVLLYSAILHEIMHAWTAWKLGDPTGKALGRITLNPVPHIDPFMTILLPVMLLVLTGGRFAYGGAKPVPINPSNFDRPSRDFALSAAAGPLTNVALGVVFLLFLTLVGRLDFDRLVQIVHGYPRPTYVGLFLGYAVRFNFLLALFNMLPIPPLDGSRVLRYLLPAEGRAFLDRIEPFGLTIIFLALFVFGLLNPLFALLSHGIRLVTAIGTGVDRADLFWMVV